MTIEKEHYCLLANAVFELRLLLGSYLGSDNAAPPDVRRAAHLAYALHNEALAVLDGHGFDIDAARVKLAAIDNIVKIVE